MMRNNFVTFLLTDYKLGTVVDDLIGGDVYTSFADGMLPENPERYLKFLEEGSVTGRTRAGLAGIGTADGFSALNKVNY